MPAIFWCVGTESVRNQWVNPLLSLSITLVSTSMFMSTLMGTLSHWKGYLFQMECMFYTFDNFSLGGSHPLFFSLFLPTIHSPVHKVCPKLTKALHYIFFMYYLTTAHILTTPWSHVFFSYGTVSLVICCFQWWQFQCVWSISTVMIMDKCWICDHKILQHAHNVSCSLCFKCYHLKCISIDPKIRENIMQNQSTWYCSLCLINVFPFNNLEDETDFMAAINVSPFNGSLRYLSDKIFLPFELNDSDHQYGCDGLDPDLNYFSSYNQYISGCNYFVESSFNSEITKTF